MDFTISYAITVCDEADELRELIAFIAERKRPEDEIVVQCDREGVTKAVEEVLAELQELIETETSCSLDNDFSAFKNNLITHCKGTYIFQLDADELPSDEIVTNLHLILATNPEVDLFLVPRVNTVEGFTAKHVKKWKWHVNEKKWINWPDYQSRVFKNSFHIRWKNKVHEQITGYSTQSVFPPEVKFALLHHKKIKKQERQNDFYDQLG